MLPVLPPWSSTTYSDHVPLGLIPSKAWASVTVPYGAAELKLTGAGAGKTGALVLYTAVRKLPELIMPPVAGNCVAPVSFPVIVPPLTTGSPDATADQTAYAVPFGATRSISMSFG